MTDVHVSNARRIGFTALALVTFWVLGWRAYEMGCERWSGMISFRSPHGEPHVVRADYTYWWLVVGPSLALVPIALLSLSVHNSLFKLRDRWILMAAILLAGAIGFSDWLAERDADRSYPDVLINYLPAPPPFTIHDFVREEYHQVSRSWLLLPIILTTAFVIWGAWRRAVKDAEVAAVYEDE